MRIVRKDQQYNTHFVAERVTNELIYRDYLQHDSRSPRDEQNKQRQEQFVQPVTKGKVGHSKSQTYQLPRLQKEVELTIELEKDRRASIAKYKSGV